MIRETFIRLSFRFDEFSLRERLSITVLLVVAAIIIWTLLSSDPYQKAKKRAHQEAKLQLKQGKAYGSEIDRINAAIKSPLVQMQLKQYYSIDDKIKQIKQLINQYRQKTIESSRLSEMLASVFQRLKNVKLISFNSLDEKMIGHPISSGDRYYQLRVIGDYFSIMTSLNTIEKLSWLVYWDELTYTVKKYPLAEAELTFHVMSKINDV